MSPIKVIVPRAIYFNFLKSLSYGALLVYSRVII